MSARLFALRPPVLSIATALGLPGEMGLKVTSCRALSTAVHWLVDGQSTAISALPASTAAGVGLPGDVGSNVTSCPAKSIAVHWLPDGPATLARCLPPPHLASVGLPPEP